MDPKNLPQLPLSKPLPTAPDIPLHDIKPLVEVPDYSFYYLIGVIVIGAVLLATLLFFLWKFYKARRDKSERKLAHKALQSIDFNDPKAAAYAITRHGYLFKDDSQRQSETFENLTARLAPYKYKKSVAPIDEETKGYFHIYLEMIDV